MESKSYGFKNKKENETGGSKFITIKKDPSKKPVKILSSIVNEFSLSAQPQFSPPESVIKKEENEEKNEEVKLENEERKEEVKIIKKPILSFSNQIQESISIAPIIQSEMIIEPEEKKEEKKLENEEKNLENEERKEEIKVIKKPILCLSNQIQDSITIDPIIINSEDKKIEKKIEKKEETKLENKEKKEEIKIIKKPVITLSNQIQDSISIAPIIQSGIKIDPEKKKIERKKSPEVKSVSPIIPYPKKKVEISECPQISFHTKETPNIINIKKKKKPITNDDILKEIEKINQEEEKIRLRKASKRKEKDKRKKKNKNERPQSVNCDRRNQNIPNITTYQYVGNNKKQELSFIPQAEFAIGNNNLKLKKVLEKQKDFSINKAADFICEGDPVLIQNRKGKKKGKKEEVKFNYPPFDIDQFLQEYYSLK